MLESALAYAERGLPVFPVHRPTDEGCSCGKKTCSTPGKHPATKNGWKDATLETSQIRKWFTGRYKGYNLGALCGIGHVCLDVDPKNHGLESFEELIGDIGELPQTWLEETGEDREGNRGRHYWFTIPKSFKGEQLKTRKPLPGYPGVDLLAAGQFAVMAPSNHTSGVQYEAMWPVDDVVDAPEALLELTGKVAEETDLFSGEGSPVRIPTGILPGPEVRHFLRHGEIPIGEQSSMISKAARALWGIWVPLEDAVDAIWEAIQKCEWDKEPWTQNQIHRHVAHEYSAAPPPPDIPNLAGGLDTDSARAYKLWEFSRGLIRYEVASGTWYRWTTTKWEACTGNQIEELVEGMARQKLQQAAFIEDDTAKAQVLKQAAQLQQRRIRSACVATAGEVIGELKVTQQDLDRDPFILNATNCAIDLKTGEGRAQAPADHITYSTRIAYREGAQSDLWEEVLADACGGDEDLIELLPVIFGYAATGSVQEDAFFYLYGPGGTGKTTVLEAIQFVLGDYATTADPDTFMLSSSAFPGGTRADLAALKGKRFVTSTEIAAGSKFSTPTINRLTGKDTIAARIPYAKAPIVFRPQWTLLFAANHFPSVPGATKGDGFWRRVKVLPFEHKVEKMNPALPHLLAQREHAEAILAWIVEGAAEWWKLYGSKSKMIEMPPVVSRAVESVQYEADYMNAFYDLLEFNPDAKILKKDLYKHYQAWATENGFDSQLTQHMLSRRLKEAHGLEDRQTYFNGKRNQSIWVGVDWAGPSGGIRVKGARKRKGSK